jgi:CP family cyanate transporter-like MFS transporter
VKPKALSISAGLVCLILIGINLRPAIVSVGPLLPSIRDRFGLSHAEASLLTAIPDVLMGVLALPTPWLARRYGRDKAILAALVLLLVATLARAFVGSFGMLLVATVAIGAGLAIAGALVGGFIKQAFSSRAAFASGIYAAALAFGSTLAAAVSSPIAQVFGSWRFGLGAWALPGLLAIGAWLFIENKQGQHLQGVRAAPQTHKLPLKNPKAWLIALFFAADNFLFYGLVSWIAPLYREHGVSPATAGLILSCFPGVFIIATPLAGLVSRGPDRRWMLAGLSGLAVLGTLGLALAPYALPFLFIPLASFGIAGGFSLGMTLPLDNTSSPEEANSWNAFVITIAYIIAASGPLLVGGLRDLTGDFQASLWLLVTVALAMLALTPFLRPRRQVEPQG